MLIIDNHKSHDNEGFILKAWEYGIIPIALPPHTTHITQPLDVACFGPLKHYHSLGVSDSAFLGNLNKSKIEFLERFPDEQAKVFTLDDILSAFIATSLSLYNPSKVLDKL